MSSCRVRLKNGAREIELEGDRLFVEEQLARYASWVQACEPRALPPEIACPPGLSPEEERELASLPESALSRLPSGFRVESRVDFPDFLRLKAPETPLGRLLVLAYYLEKYRLRPCYAPAELAQFWKDSWPAESLEPELWQEAVSQGFLEWETPEALTLTYRGQIHVRDGLA